MKTLGALLGIVAVLLVAAPPQASAAQVIPNVGLTRSVDSDDTNKSVGLAFRGSLIPRVLKAEIAGSYRSEEHFDGDLKLRMWPITTSLLLAPIPNIYGLAGVGWYQTTFDYADETLLEDETKGEFGVHLGGGLTVPIAPSAGIDLNGRYVMMQDQESKLVPEKFDPDFWNLSLGLALGF